jgi:hypothetical protein
MRFQASQCVDERKCILWFGPPRVMGTAGLDR